MPVTGEASLPFSLVTVFVSFSYGMCFQSVEERLRALIGNLVRLSKQVIILSH